MEDHLESILLDPKKIKPNTAHHYINFLKDNINSNEEMDTFLKFIALKINRISIDACIKDNRNLLDRLLKIYYSILKIKNNYLKFNLNSDHTVIACFYIYF